MLSLDPCFFGVSCVWASAKFAWSLWKFYMCDGFSTTFSEDRKYFPLLVCSLHRAEDVVFCLALADTSLVSSQMKEANFSHQVRSFHMF